MNFTAFDQRLCVVRNHLEADIERLKRRFVLTELHLADRLVQADARVESQVEWIDLQHFIESSDSLVEGI